MRKRDNRRDQQGMYFRESLSIPPRSRLSLPRATTLCDLMGSSPVLNHPFSTLSQEEYIYQA